MGIYRTYYAKLVLYVLENMLHCISIMLSNAPNLRSWSYFVGSRHIHDWKVFFCLFVSSLLSISYFFPTYNNKEEQLLVMSITILGYSQSAN